MEITFNQSITCHLPKHSGIGSELGLSLDKTGLMLFFLLILCSFFLNSAKVIIFVRLFDCPEYINCPFDPFDKSGKTTVFYKLNRLLQFTRAVICPALTGSRRMVGAGKKSCMALQQPVYRKKEIRILPYNGMIRYCGLFSALPRGES